jgi:hypothetical protein
MHSYLSFHYYYYYHHHRRRHQISNDNVDRAHPDATTLPQWTDDELNWIRTLPYTIDIPQHDIMVPTLHITS